MIVDNTTTTDKISITLNGKPVTTKPIQPKKPRKNDGHIEHLCDLPFIEGPGGVMQAVRCLRALGSMLTGGDTANVSLKFDGSPAIFAGIDPADGKFFIAKKSIFNKEPKIYKSISEIREDLARNEDLYIKFCTAFNLLSKSNIKGVIHGDFLYTTNDIKKQVIGGAQHYTFQPNTIVYAAPVDSLVGSKIKQTKMGIVWHTAYEGDSLADMKPIYNQKIEVSCPDAWFPEAVVDSVPETALFNPKEYEAFNAHIAQIDALFNVIDHGILNRISNDPYLLQVTKTFINTQIRASTDFSDAANMAKIYLIFLRDTYVNTKETKKSQQGLINFKVTAFEVDELINTVPARDLEPIFKLIYTLSQAKAMVLSRMSSLSSMGCFIKEGSTLRHTDPEGFVQVFDGLNIKLVDRFEFSKVNFSEGILRQWPHK